MNLKPEEQARIDKVVELLKEKGIQQLHLYNFGTYRQYELAGDTIRPQLLADDFDNEYTDEEFANLRVWLKFTEKKDFMERLHLPNSGQNRLFLTAEGDFEFEYFSI